ncbi:PH domain-containing protein [Actinomadura alba]|uniref:PH domain-containing protein n=1 Tax=Actinomadura alba TaxID=406431 RepID=A0ABR7LIU8_9ACTN|nr:PH domain-containing protein [Actinomadura alba]MBC6464685.1 PH domain-containing protein [Actinomadura alba]
MSETKRAAGAKPKVFRSVGPYVAGWVWMVVAALNLADIVIRGRDMAALIAAAVLLMGCGLAYVYGLRPAIVADETGVRLRNPLRDVRIPWPALKEVEVAEALRFHCVADGRPWQVKAWVMQTSPRARARMERRAEKAEKAGTAAGGVPDPIAEQLKGRTPAGFAAEQLTELVGAHGGGERAAEAAAGEGTERPSGTWSTPAIAAVALPGAVLVALILVAALT